MDRRKFFGLLSAGIAGIALEQAIPLGRVWSFPKKIVISEFIELPPGSSARVIQAWDHRLRATVQRLDILAPIFVVQPLLGVEKYRTLRGIDKLYPDMVPEVPITSFRCLRDAINGRLETDQLYGVTTKI